MALNRRNLFSHSSGSCKSIIKESAELAPSGCSEEESVPCLSPSFWCWLAFLAFLCCLTYDASLCLCFHMMFICVWLCDSVFSFNKDTVIGLGHHFDKLEQQRPYCQIMSHSEVLSAHEFWQNAFQSSIDKIISNIPSVITFYI